MRFVFYDPAGELHKSVEIHRLAGYLAHAPVVMILVGADSLAPLRTRASRPDETLEALCNNVETTIRTALGTRVNRKVNRTLVVLVTKADLMKLHLPKEAFSTMRAEWPSPAQIEQHQQAVARALGEWEPGIVNWARTSFREVGFFAASALGTPPVQGTLPSVEPVGVVAPFLWALQRRRLARRRLR